MTGIAVFKFMDESDGNFAFVIAEDGISAKNKLEEKTSVPVVLIGQQPLEKHLPLIWKNNILPF